LAVLKAEIKPQKLLRFLDLNKTGELSSGARSQWSAARWLETRARLAKRPSLRNRPIDWKLRGNCREFGRVAGRK
jgi:hypothetical protein